MPLVYPPNFKGVNLTYEYRSPYTLRSGDAIYDAIALEASSGSDNYVEVQPRHFFFYLEIVDNRHFKVCGFVNTSDSNRVTVVSNPGKTYYTGYGGYTNEGDGCFVLLWCRMALNGTFSNVIPFCVFLEMGVSYAGHVLSWENIPIRAYLDIIQEEDS